MKIRYDKMSELSEWELKTVVIKLPGNVNREMKILKKNHNRNASN
jgi:hypothetical protein